MNEEIPDDALALLRDTVSSFEQVEALLLLQREATREWSAMDIAEQLTLPVESLGPFLDALALEGLVVRRIDGVEVRWRYAPADAKRDQAVIGLLEIYERRRLVVIRLLTSFAMQRIRDAAVRAFADSFMLGKKKKL